ncbi:MAG: sodium/solute symporter [Phycisphaerae bacterium]|nr:sodium/solute symporter [Phycisphaerae bacterium]
MGFAAIDWIVIALYFAVVMGIAVWVIRQRQRSSADYFLAGRHVGWFVIGASLFASNIGSEHLVGLAGAGADSGVAMAHYELHAWCLLVLGWVLVPFYSRSAVFTMPEFLERRYSPAARWFLSLVSLVAYIFTKVSVALFAGGIVFKTLFPQDLLPWMSNFWLGAILVVVFTGIYTVLGGLKAVVYTDAMQTVVLILGSTVVTIIGLHKLGGWGQLKEVCGSEMFNLWKPINDPNFPWFGMLFAAPIVGMWYWCTDQYIVQRTLAAPDEKTARRATIFASYLKLTPVLLFIIPGMIAYALAKTGKLDSVILQEGQSNQAFPLMVRELLPAGLRGLVVGGLLAALMSSLSSVFNSCSTLFTIDIYKKVKPNTSELTLVWVGRIATAAMVVLGLLWIPFMKYVSGALYVYLQSVQAYIAPPIFAVFFLGVFIKRINAPGCMAGLVGGSIIGMARLVAEVSRKYMEGSALYQDGTFLHWFANVNFLYFCLILFAASVGLIVGVSLLTKKPSPEQIEGLTYATTTAKDREESRASWSKWDVINTIIVLLLILTAYLYFRGF